MINNSSQPGILAPCPRMARHLTFSLKPGAAPQETLKKLSKIADGETIVVGLGESLVLALKGKVEGLRTFPNYVSNGIEIPSTPVALWCWLRGSDRGELLHQSRMLRSALAESFQLDSVIDAFQYGDSLDLTGYEDGTENPVDEDAVNAAIVQGMGTGMDGSSFMAVQQWLHNLDAFQTMPPQQQDYTFGRSISDNEELDEAPESAHVKRTAQESFEPEAFIVRRSMPWADATREGLVFLAFVNNFNLFDVQLRRMVGFEDGIIDALFTFTRPITGSYLWCPPMAKNHLDLSAVGI